MRYRITEVDINKNVYISESYKQYDNNVKYSILLKEDGKDVDLEGCMITAFFKTKSGKIYNKNCTFDKNVVSVILDNNILGECGYVDVEFNIVKDEEIVTTFNIMFEVEKSIDRNGAIIENPQWDILNDIKFIKDSIEIFEPYVLPIATSTVLGGVKIGKGLSIDSDGFLSTIIDRISWSIVTDKPAEFNPSQHEHKMDEITDLYIPNVEDVLNSTNTNNSLSANQGRLLNDKITVLQSDSHIHVNKTLLDGITQSKIDEWNNKSNFSGSYNDLTNKPTKLSEFINDGDYTTKTYVDNVITNYQTRIDNTLATTSKEIPNAINEVKSLIDNKSDFNGDYNSLTNRPSIPTKTSELTNDSTFTTKKYVDDEIVKAVTGGTVDLTDYQTKTDNNLTTTNKTIVGAINEVNSKPSFDGNYNNLTNKPTKLSEFINDNEFTTKTYVDNAVANVQVDLTDYQTKTDNTLNTTDKTIVGAINEVNSKPSFDGNYNNLTNKPTKLSEFINDNEFTTKTYVDNAVANVQVDLTDYQTKTDNALNTTSKVVTGAINELKISIDSTGKISDNELNNLINKLLN